MSTPGTENDPLLDDRFEAANRAVDVVVRTLRDVVLLGLAIAVTVAAYYTAKAARDVSAWAVEARAATIEQQAMLVGQVGDVLTEVRGVTKDARAATQQAAGVLTDIRSSSLPKINLALDDLHKTAGQVQQKIDTTSPKIDAILEDTDATVRTVNHTIEVRSDQVGAVIAELEKTSENVAILTAPDQVEPVLESIRASSASLALASGHVAVITDNAEAVSTFYREKVIPRPYKPTGNFLLKGFKYAGHYSLEVLKSTPQFAVVALQVIR